MTPKTFPGDFQGNTQINNALCIRKSYSDRSSNSGQFKCSYTVIYLYQWLLHDYVFDTFGHTPILMQYLAVTSAERWQWMWSR